MLETIDIDLAGRRVLDAGCNRGGFLRLLADRYAIAEGFGYDPASGAVEDARRLAGQRPLQFEAADTLPARWPGISGSLALRGVSPGVDRRREPRRMREPAIRIVGSQPPGD